MKSGVVLISGRGSNLKAILTARLDLDIRCVISNRPEAKGLDIAFSHQIPTRVVNHQAYPDRQHFDRALAETIDQFTPDYIILAGFLRIFTDTFVLHYNNRMINIHPSLLPAFTGLNTHARALA
ncbi:MAG: phosphoribosylglycinamide formyltransferase, partial [Pseudomonadota bacterium]|nr:phosphoribosylglycinamide formyltransferase [Pseudomonadota bacterium]